MSYTTYENHNNQHVTIHKDGCNQIAKRGGIHIDGNGLYKQHETYQNALSYAKKTGLPPRNCSFCNPP